MLLRRANLEHQQRHKWGNLSDAGRDYVKLHVNDLIEELTVRVMRKSGKSDQEIANYLGKSIEPSQTHGGIKWATENINDEDLVALDGAIAIMNRTDDVGLISQKMNVPQHVVNTVKRHYFMQEHLIPFDGGKLVKGVFTKDPEEIAIWEAAALHGLTRKVVSSRTEISVVEANAIFKRLIAHEYVESKLMQNGYMFNSLKGRYTINPVNFGAHDLSIKGGSISEYSHWDTYLKIKKTPSEFGGDYTKLDTIVTEILNIVE
jgi:hypothetical protein